MLPFMRVQPKKYQRQTVRFGGYNATSNAIEGELKSSKNLTVEQFPYLANRKGRSLIRSFTRPTALFSFNGFVIVDGTDLLYNNQIVGTVTAGPKQFAVINNKLVIHPDMILLDLTNNKIRKLSGEMITEPNTVTFGNDGTRDYLEVASALDGGSGSRAFPYTTSTEPTVKVYTALTWDSGTGWDKTPADGTEYTVTELATAFAALGSGEKLYIIPSKVTETGAYVIPTKTGGVWSGSENSDGVYFELTSAVNAGSPEYKWGKYNAVLVSGDCYYTQGSFAYEAAAALNPGDSWTLKNGYSFNSYANTFSATYYGNITIGYGVSGTAYDVSSGFIRKYVSNGTTLTSYVLSASSSTYGCDSDYYVKGSTLYGYVYGASGAYPNNGYSAGYWYVNEGVSGYNGTVTVGYKIISSLDVDSFLDNFIAGDVVKLSGCTSIAANNVDTLTIHAVTATKITFTVDTLASGSEAGTVKIEREIPALDFICANDNRLWGVNSEGVYASAWADPTNFKKLAGLSTDSYFAEVGSAGEFTGVFSYSGDALLFKEDKMYRVFGNFPAEYSIQSYDIAGLQSGCEKSMAIINETLFYKGKEGVYALSGSTPQLISQPLELSKHFNAKAGADGAHYYISMQDDAGLWHLFVFDTITKLWIREDDSQAIEFAYQNGSLHMLSANNSLYKLNDVNSTEEVEWEAEFAVFFGDTLSRKTNNRLFLRVDLEAESLFEIEVKFDEGEFRRVFSDIFKGRKTMNIPVPIMRCDSFTLKLKGIGNCKIMAMEREFILGSEY